MPAKYARLGDCALHLVHDGPTTLPGRPPEIGAAGLVLALHDVGRHGWDFEAVQARLAEDAKAPRFVAFDQPAHGRSSGLDSLGDVGRLADLTLRLLDWLEVDRALLLGHGLGGAVALRLALDAPGRVRGVVTLAAGARLPVPDDTFETMRQVTEGKARRPFDASVFAEGTPPDVLRPWFMQGMKTDPRATFGDLEACRAWNDAARLSSLEAPVLAMVGEHEREDVRSAVEALVQAVPNAKLQVMSRAAHVLPIEATDAVAEAVRTFDRSPS